MAVDDIGLLVWFQGVFGPHQGRAKDLHRFMRHQCPMFGQNARHCLRCSTVCLLLHCGPLSMGLEAPSNELSAVPVLHADPMKVLRLFSFCICGGAVRLNSSKQCAYACHLVHIGVVAIGVQYSVRVGGRFVGGRPGASAQEHLRKVSTDPPPPPS